MSEGSKEVAMEPELADGEDSDTVENDRPIVNVQ